MGAVLFACLRQVPKTALGTDEQLVSQVAVVDARPIRYRALARQSRLVKDGRVCQGHPSFTDKIAVSE